MRQLTRFHQIIVLALALTPTTVVMTTGATLAQQDAKTPWETGRLSPNWADAKIVQTKHIYFDSKRTPEQNGNSLAKVMKGLQPGERLLIDPGKYVFGPKLTLNLKGTAQKPIRIEAANPRNPPVLTRDARQNLLNIGEGAPTRFVLLRGLELTGGSVGIRFYNVANFWLDQCHIYNCAHGGITANTADTAFLFITRNHIHDFRNGTGEAMYLGANHSKHIMRNSVIANNHVHHCGGDQGDGIEVKQGSFNNWIFGNHVHETKYPCIIAYGTNGKGINVIENNICYRSGDNVMQVQGEAIVQNNLLMSGKASGLASTDHQGKTTNLKVTQNTIINQRLGLNLTSWNNRKGMVISDNAVYAKKGMAIRFSRGSAGVKMANNRVSFLVQEKTTDAKRPESIWNSKKASSAIALLQNITPNKEPMSKEQLNELIREVRNLLDDD